MNLNIEFDTSTKELILKTDNSTGEKYNINPQVDSDGVFNALHNFIDFMKDITGYSYGGINIPVCENLEEAFNEIKNEYSACLDGLHTILGEDDEFVKKFTEIEGKLSFILNSIERQCERHIKPNTIDRVFTPAEYTRLITDGETSMLSEKGETLDLFVDTAFEGNIWSFPLSESAYLFEEHPDEMVVLVKIIERNEAGEEYYDYRWYEVPDIETKEELEMILKELDI